MDEYQDSSHSKWECQYQGMFIPKCRRKTLYAQLRQGFAAGDEALERYFTIPSSTILPLQCIRSINPTLPRLASR